MKKKSAKLLLCLCIFWSSLAQTQGLPDIVPISKEKEKNMGVSLSRQVEEKYEAVDEPEVQKRFQKIGEKLAASCDNRSFIYHFKVLKSTGENEEESYNAFALPGGYVYMFDALFEVLKTDDKIAAVTAHEIGHIQVGHAVKRLQSSLGMNVLMLLAITQAHDARTVAKANEAIVQLMMSYSREDEFEADRLSVEYLRKAGFNPQGVLESLKTLRELRKGGRERKFTFYRSHPYLSERIAAAQQEIRGYIAFDDYINLPEKKD